ncbi:uncharacterized protein PFLUO_LOCUS1954 [Penicillium psychrofluorescens]|uniref:uncharacterized protein n=1 Tax=Penicillium psychrofluorescens TaxID=3158075 RepID=UPI003CCD1243
MSQGSRRGSDDTSPASRNRDYLSSRPDVQTPRAGPRQPSPLHTSSLPLSYLHDDSASSQSPLSARSSANPSPATNRSPMARVANAAFPAPPSTAAASSSRAPEMTIPEASAEVAGGFNVPKQAAGMEPDRSETSSPKSTTSSVLGDRTPQRMMPRTSSIDSAISSLSAPSHKSSFDANALSPADINNIISKAGSAEAVIIHLLKEKHHAASQNSQLWKLVDKQRTLILGLNKDLERAFKEKDQYKKKLKEIQQAAPPLAAADSRGLSADRHDSLLPKPLSRLQTQPANGEGRSDMRAGGNAQASESDPTSPTSPSDSRTSRKAPPAPLNLKQKENADPNDSGSDYGDVLEVDELRSKERGRRKTREEDDQDREAVQDEAVIYDGAKPSKSGTSQSSRETASTSSATVPRELSSRSPPNVGGAGPLGSILSSRTAPSNGRNMMTMPKSPGLPLSPRPEDRPIGSPLPRMPTRDITNPMASSSMAAGYNLAGLPLSPRAPNYPVPFSPGDAPSTTGRPGMSIPSIDPAVKIDSPITAKFSETSIYQGLVSEDNPGLLLPPNALPLIQVRVSSSRLRPSRNSYLVSRPLDEEPVFTLSVISRSETSELWRVEKVIGSVPQLDQQVKQTSSFAGKLPDRALFSGHSPAKVDARRAALNAYFDSLLDTPMDETAALIVCQFLTNDAIEARDDETSLLKGSPTKPDILRGADGKPRKEGYLTKRGKNFGGWKARYFVLHGPELKYFESPGGAHMGTIRLHHAQIGKQSQNSSSQATSGGDDDTDNQYRHAFLVLEPKKKDSSALVRHVLCSESDAERDAWVDALMEYVESSSSDNESSRGPSSSKSQASTQAKQSSAGSEPRSAAKSKLFSGNGSKKSTRTDETSELIVGDPVQGFSFDDAVAAEPPILGTTLDQAPPRSPRIPSTMSLAIGDTTQPIEPALQSPKMISAPKNGAVIQDVGAWGNKPTTTSTKEKKRSIWGFRTRSSLDLASQGGASSDVSAANSNIQAERKDPVRPVFGIPLVEAVEYCPPQGVNVELPAVVYRCIEYLHSQGAASEEGIFRLSGSNVVIKALKERFNTEGDIDFLAGDQYYDVHAVASLFKQYLRELPTTVLTRELHLDFLRVLELDEKQKKLAAFNSLVHRLPSANLTLLSALSQFLIEIVNNSDVNKMTVRNVGIVFAPTLNIPAPVFSMFLTDYDSIFGDLSSGPGPSVELTVDRSRTLSADDIRSPRHQMFSEIPTPSYNQTSFRGQSEPSSAVEPPRAPHQDTGFIPMQPTYDQNAYQQQMYNQQAGNSAGFTSLNGMLVPNNPDDTRSARSKRRESSMLFMENTSGEPIKFD